MADETEPKSLKNSTPTKDGDKLEGQCQAPGCLSTREPNGEKYTCPVHAKKKGN